MVLSFNIVNLIDISVGERAKKKTIGLDISVLKLARRIGLINSIEKWWIVFCCRCQRRDGMWTEKSILFLSSSLFLFFFNLTKHLPFFKKLNGRLFVIISRYTRKRPAFIGLDSIFVAPPSFLWILFSKSWAQNRWHSFLFYRFNN